MRNEELKLKRAIFQLKHRAPQNSTVTATGIIQNYKWTIITSEDLFHEGFRHNGSADLVFGDVAGFLSSS